jgi:hypothetical protein
MRLPSFNPHRHPQLALFRRVAFSRGRADSEAMSPPGTPAGNRGGVMDMPQGMPALQLGGPAVEPPMANPPDAPGSGRLSSSRINTARDRPGQSPKAKAETPETQTSLSRPRTPGRGDSKG